MIVSTDSKGRVSLSTTAAGSSFAWKKDGLTFATTNTGATTDYRPDKNYRYVPAQSCTETGSFSNDYAIQHRSTNHYARKTYNVGDKVAFTFTGVEFGVCLDVLLSGNGYPAHVQAQWRIDGGAWETVDLQSDSYSIYSVILWGKGNLANTSHTVEVKLSGNADGTGMRFDGYYYSDRSRPIGSSVTYSVVIDGSTTETITVTPTINRQAVAQSWVDQIVSIYTTYTPSTFREITEHAGCAAMAYYITGDSRLLPVIGKIYSAYIVNSNATTGVLNASNGLTWNARIGYNWWLAYRIFGDSRFLAIADKFVTCLRDSWPRSSAAMSGVTYNGLWCSDTDAGDVEADGNRWSCPSFSCALLYNEPASAHYGSATVRQRVLDNMAWAMTSVLSDGSVIVGPGHSTQPTRDYGLYQLEHAKYISDSFGVYVTEVAAMANWLSSFGADGPAWFTDAFSVNFDHVTPSTPNSDIVINELFAYALAGKAIPAGYVDLAYSAAFAGPGAPYCVFNPIGAADATTGNTIYDVDRLFRSSIFWGARSAYINSIDRAVYAYNCGIDTAAPTITAFAIPSTSVSLTVPITTLTATDDEGVTGYKITESDTVPLASDPGWSDTAPESITFSSAGVKTPRAWAKDAAGNVSAGVSASVTITLPDTTAPTATLTLGTSTGLTVPVTLTANETGCTFVLSEDGTTPDGGWGSTPGSYAFSSAGSKTLYAWAKDSSDNVSARASASVTVLAPSNMKHINGAQAGSLKKLNGGSAGTLKKVY